MADSGVGVFLLMANGKIDYIELPEFNNVYCKYQYVFGPDWDMASGLEEGLTNTLKKGLHQERIIVNHPIDVGFKSTSPTKWPQLIVHVYGYDGRGKDVVRGYGLIHIPVQPGRHVLKFGLFVPEQPSAMKRISDWMKGSNPEFVDARVLAENEGRQVTRVRTQGSMTVTFNIILKDFSAMGYDARPSTESEFFPS